MEILSNHPKTIQSSKLIFRVIKFFSLGLLFSFFVYTGYYFLFRDNSKSEEKQVQVVENIRKDEKQEYQEIDPVFSIHPVSEITDSDIEKWTEAYVKSQESSSKQSKPQVTTLAEQDPVFKKHIANTLNSARLSQWDDAFGWGNHAGLYLNLSHPAKDVTGARIQNWDKAFEWGNHASQGYIKDGNTGWNNTYGFITASSSNTLTNKSGNISMWTNDAGYLTSATAELDPIFLAHVASGILTADISNWNTAYSWGNHSTAGYLTSLSETDPVFIAWDRSTGIVITESQISDLNHFTNSDETDPIFSASSASGITGTNISNWDTAYGWGNHSTQGYISDGNTGWDNSYGFITASSSNLLTNKSGNISMWSNDVGYLTSATLTETDPVFTAWDKSTGIVITESQISDLNHFTNSDETDPIFSASSASGITGTNISNWNTVYGWGNHSTQGYISDGNTNWDNSYGFITDGNTGWDNIYGFITIDTNNYLTGINFNTSTGILTATRSGLADLTTGFDGRYALLNHTQAWSTITSQPNIISSLDGVTNDEGNIDLIAGSNIIITSDDINNTITISATGSSIIETDPIFSASSASGITGTNISNWDTAYGWGNHSTQGYISDGNTGWDNSYGFITASSSNTLTNKSGNISMWSNDAGYLTSFSETDPVFSASSASGITGTNISNWDTAYGWGDHSAVGYISDGNTGWDNSYGFITASSTDTFTNKSGNISMWSNDAGYLTSFSETDPIFSASSASGITGTNISNWNTAYTHSQIAHLMLGTTSSTAFRGDYGLLAYNERGSQIAGSGLSWNGSSLVVSNPFVGTDLSYTSSSRLLSSSTGVGVTLPLVTTATAGLMSHTDKSKLDFVASGADNYGSWLISASGTAGTGIVNSGNTVTISAGSGINSTRSGNTITISNTSPHIGTNLSIGSNTATVVRVDSSTGTNASLPVATSSLAGILSADTQTIGGAKTFSAGTTTLSSASAILNFSSTTGVKQIMTGTNTSLALMPGGTGNVGIGTTNPLGDLHIYDGTGNTTIVFESLLGNSSNTGYKSPATVTQTSSGSPYIIAWTNPSNVMSSNNNNATVTLGAFPEGTSETLLISNFGSNVPAGRNILGIRVEIEGVSPLSPDDGIVVQLLKANSQVGNTKYQNLLGNNIYTIFGNSTDFWGTTWTSSDINNAGFGVSIYSNNGYGSGQDTFEIDHVRVIVFYEGGLWSSGIDTNSNGNFKISNSSNLGTNDFLTITEYGNIGINSNSLIPTTALDVNGLIRVRNPQGETVAPTRSNNGEFAFAEVASTGRLYFRANGTNYYINSSGTGDYSEYFLKRDQEDNFVQGQIVTLIDGGVDITNDIRKKPLGVISAFGTRGNDQDGERHNDRRFENIGLLGQVPVIVTTVNGQIDRSTSIGVSEVSGIGKRMTSGGYTIGQSLEDTRDWDEDICMKADSLDSIDWPEDDGTNRDKPCYLVSVSSFSQEEKNELNRRYDLEEEDNIYIGKVMMYINSGYYLVEGLTGLEGSDQTQSLEQTDEESTLYISQILGGMDMGWVIDTGLEVDYLRVEKDALFKGNIVVQGHMVLGKDTVGQAMIRAGDSYVDVMFENEYAYEPIVMITPLLSNLPDQTFEYYLLSQNSQGFRIGLSTRLEFDVVFNWYAFANTNSNMIFSDNFEIFPEIEHSADIEITSDLLSLDQVENNIIEDEDVESDSEEVIEIEHIGFE